MMTAALRTCWRILPGLACCLSILPLAAQQVDQPVAGQPQSAPGPRRQRGPGGGHGPGGLMHGLFQAAPEDKGPLKPGEADELLAFAQQHAPRVYQLLCRLRQRDPAAFEEKLASHAPHLRHLRRIYELNPQMGAIVQTYADGLVSIERTARLLRDKTPAAPDYSTDLEKLRTLVTANLQRECDALDLVADQFEQDRAARIDRRVAYLTSDEVDLSAEPPELQKEITAFRGATRDAERAKLREPIQAAAAQQVDAEVAGLRARATRLREDQAAEIDRRVKQALEAPPRRGPHHGPPH